MEESCVPLGIPRFSMLPGPPHPIAVFCCLLVSHHPSSSSKQNPSRWMCQFCRALLGWRSQGSEVLRTDTAPRNIKFYNKYTAVLGATVVVATRIKWTSNCTRAPPPIINLSSGRVNCNTVASCKQTTAMGCKG